MRCHWALAHDASKLVSVLPSIHRASWPASLQHRSSLDGGAITFEVVVHNLQPDRAHPSCLLVCLGRAITVLCRSSVVGGGSKVFVGNLVCISGYSQTLESYHPSQYWDGQLFCKAQYNIYTSVWSAHNLLLFRYIKFFLCIYVIHH